MFRIADSLRLAIELADIDRVFLALFTGWQLEKRVEELRLTGNSPDNYRVLTDVKRVRSGVYISESDVLLK